MPVYIALAPPGRSPNPSYTGIASEVSGEPSRVILRNRFPVSACPRNGQLPHGVIWWELSLWISPWEVYNFSDVSLIGGVVEGSFLRQGFTVNPALVEKLSLRPPREKRYYKYNLALHLDYAPRTPIFLRVEGRFGEMLDVSRSGLMVDWETSGNLGIGWKMSWMRCPPLAPQHSRGW